MVAATVLQKASDSLTQYRKALLAQHVMYARSLWGRLKPADWWNDVIIMGIAAQVAQNYVRVVEEARRAGVSYADVILSAYGVKPVGSVDSLKFPRRGTDPWMVSAKPALGAYRDKAVQSPTVRPDTWPKPGDTTHELISSWLEAAYERLETTVETDITLASNDAATERFTKNGTKAFRRVIHPEASMGGVCGLCIAAATRVYTKKDLLALHDHCHCTVAPILHGQDLGKILNTADLHKIYAAVTNTPKWKKDHEGRYATEADFLKNLRYKVVAHSELGRLLVPYERTHETMSDYAAMPDVDESVLASFDRMAERSKLFLDTGNKVHATGEPITFTDQGKEWQVKPSPDIPQALTRIESLTTTLQSAFGRSA